MNDLRDFIYLPIDVWKRTKMPSKKQKSQTLQRKLRFKALVKRVMNHSQTYCLGQMFSISRCSQRSGKLCYSTCLNSWRIFFIRLSLKVQNGIIGNFVIMLQKVTKAECSSMYNNRTAAIYDIPCTQPISGLLIVKASSILCS